MKTKSNIIFLKKNVGSKVLAPRHLSSWLDSTLNSSRNRAKSSSAPTKKHSFKSTNLVNPDSEILSKICVICVICLICDSEFILASLLHNLFTLSLF